MRRLNALATVLCSVALGVLFEDKFLDAVNARFFGDKEWATFGFAIAMMFACVVVLLMEVWHEKGAAD